LLSEKVCVNRFAYVIQKGSLNSNKDDSKKKQQIQGHLTVPEEELQRGIQPDQPLHLANSRYVNHIQRHPHTDYADGLGEQGDNDQEFGQPRPLGDVMLGGDDGDADDGKVEEGDSNYIPFGADEGDTRLVQIGGGNAHLTKVNEMICTFLQDVL